MSSFSIAQIKTVAKEKARILSTPDPISAQIGSLDIGDTVIVYSYSKGMWCLSKGKIKGFVSDIFFETRPELSSLKPLSKPTTYEWPTYIKIGISIGDLTHLIGQPTIINKTETESTIYYQYVYRKDGSKDKYYYFENGILTSFQE